MNKTLLTLLVRLQVLAAREDGQSVIEYSLIVFLVAISSVALLRPIATAVVALLIAANNVLQTA